MNKTLSVRVHAVRPEAEDILSFELRPESPADRLPAFTAGAHIDIHLPAGLVRPYSLLNDPAETHRYIVAVFKEPGSRGGSRHLHASVRAGDRLTIGVPRNNFELHQQAPHTVLIAGGIGITALWSMVQCLEARGESWELHYACRSPGRAALLDRIQAIDPAGARVHLAWGDDPSHARLDIAAIVGAAPPGAHLYCCGPARMLSAFEAAAGGRPADTVHMEHFAPIQDAHTDGGFCVELARTGRTVDVKAGETILDALLDAGVIVPYSCGQGTCGCCEVKVLDGVPDHRDQILSEAERAGNASMFVCCSGARTSRLVLDL